MLADGLSQEARAALDLAPCGLLRTDTSGLILRANQTFCNWTGHTQDSLVGRRRLQDLLTMGGRIFHQTHWTPLLQMQRSISEVKLEVVRSGGDTVPMVLNAVRRAEADGLVDDLAVFVARDRDTYERELVLSRKKLEQAVEQARRLQEESDDRAQFAEQMVGIVSHDLRNPLSTIQMGAVLLRRDASTSQVRVLDRVSRASDRALRLISELLDFTQARLGGGITTSPAPIDPHAVVGEAVEELVQAHPGRELLHRATGEGQCMADADRLSQLVGNLVSNAIAYGDPHTPVVVQTHVHKASFELSVHNRGPAIPVAQQRAIFQPMTRGISGGSAVRSVGLGLYIVSEIARAHGGTVEVESSDSAGTLFRVVFP
jgi:sigma-B regulation protein RsbU (phosphoserine phosphatase)